MSIDHETEIMASAPEELVRAYHAAADRLAKLRELEARLPTAVLAAQERHDALAGELGFKVARSRSGPSIRARREGRQRQVLAQLPGSATEVARALHITPHAARSVLVRARPRGEVTFDGDVWRRVES